MTGGRNNERTLPLRFSRGGVDRTTGIESGQGLQSKVLRRIAACMLHNLADADIGVGRQTANKGVEIENRKCLALYLLGACLPFGGILIFGRQPREQLLAISRLTTVVLVGLDADTLAARFPLQVERFENIIEGLLQRIGTDARWCKIERARRRLEVAIFDLHVKEFLQLIKHLIQGHCKGRFGRSQTFRHGLRIGYRNGHEQHAYTRERAQTKRKKFHYSRIRYMFAKDNKKILEFKILTLQQTQVRRKMGSALENQSLSFRLRHS